MKGRQYYFIGDLAIGSQSTFDREKRNFKSLKDMSRSIVDIINVEVGKNDVIYHIGEIGKSHDDIVNFRKSIICNTFYLIGTNLNPSYKKYFSEFYHKSLEIPNSNVILISGPYISKDFNLDKKLYIYSDCHVDIHGGTNQFINVHAPSIDYMPLTKDDLYNYK